MWYRQRGGGAQPRREQCVVWSGTFLSSRFCCDRIVRLPVTPSPTRSLSAAALRPPRWITWFGRQSLRKVHFYPKAKLRSVDAARCCSPTTLYMTIAKSPGHSWLSAASNAPRYLMQYRTVYKKKYKTSTIYVSTLILRSHFSCTKWKYYCVGNIISLHPSEWKVWKFAICPRNVILKKQ